MTAVFIILGAILRLFLIPLPGFKADMAFWKAWSLAASDRGIIWLVKNTNYNYPPAFEYVLWVIGKIYTFFANPHDLNYYWREDNLAYLFLFKSFIIVADILVVYLIIKIARELKSRWGIALAIFYFLSPAVLFDGAHWGQVDQFGLMLFLMAIYLLLKERPILAAIIFTISFLMKFQNIIFIPLFYLFIYKKYSFNEVIKSLKYSLLVFVIVCLPFILTRESATILRLLTQNSDWFPYYSLNAFNLWWIAAGAQGMALIDKNLIIGITNAKSIGLYLFILAYFISAASLYFAKKEDLFKKFVIASTFAIYSFFILPTQSHERYSFHLMGLVPIIIMLAPKEKRKRLIGFFIAFSLLLFLNLYLSMFFNYPDQVFWPFRVGETRLFTVILSVGQIGLYIYFFIELLSRDFLKHKAYTFSAVFLIVALVFIQNLKYIFKEPISLTKIKPVSASQDYLSPIYNMTVNSNIDPKSWQRLSDNYFFYENGIGSHADSMIEYAINAKFSRFISDFGVDTEADVEPKVIFSVWADGREIFQSKEKGRFDGPSHVEVDIKGVKRLVLKINRVGESIRGAHADWLGPELIR